MDKPANAWAWSKAIAPSIITTHSQLKKIVSINFLYFPDGPMVTTPYFLCKGHMFNHCLGTNTDMGTSRASFVGFPGGSDSKESACNAADPWVGRIPWRRAWQPTPVFFPGESPWTEEPDELQSMGLQRAGHDWMTRHSEALPHILNIFNMFNLKKVFYSYFLHLQSFL